MGKRTVFLALIFLFWSVTSCHALEWKRLHEKADATGVSAAMEAADKSASLDDLYVLGLVYLNLHREKEAEEAFNRMKVIDPGLIEARWGLAEILRRRHSLDESERLLNEIIKENSAFTPAYISLAYLRYLKMDFNGSGQLALSVMNQGMDAVDQMNVVRAITMYAGAKGMIAHYGGPLSKAVNGTPVFSYLKKAEKLQPDSSAALFGLGSFYLLAPGLIGGDIDKALEYLEKAVKADPLFASVYVRLAQAYRMKKDETKYQFYLNKALEVDPGNEIALDIQSGRCKFICVGKKGR